MSDDVQEPDILDMAWGRYTTCRMNVLYYEGRLSRLKKLDRAARIAFALFGLGSIGALGIANDDWSQGLSALCALLTAAFAFVLPTLEFGQQIQSHTVLLTRYRVHTTRFNALFEAQARLTDAALDKENDTYEDTVLLEAQLIGAPEKEELNDAYVTMKKQLAS